MFNIDLPSERLFWVVIAGSMAIVCVGAVLGYVAVLIFLWVV